MLDDMGIVDQMLSAGSKSHGVNIYHGADRLLHVSYDDLESPYPFLLNVPQSTLEGVLGAFVTGLGLRGRVEHRTRRLHAGCRRRDRDAARRRREGRDGPCRLAGRL